MGNTKEEKELVRVFNKAVGYAANAFDFVDDSQKQDFLWGIYNNIDNIKPLKDFIVQLPDIDSMVRVIDKALKSKNDDVIDAATSVIHLSMEENLIQDEELITRYINGIVDPIDKTSILREALKHNNIHNKENVIGWIDQSYEKLINLLDTEKGIPLEDSWPLEAVTRAIERDLLDDPHKVKNWVILSLHGKNSDTCEESNARFALQLAEVSARKGVLEKDDLDLFKKIIEWGVNVDGLDGGDTINLVSTLIDEDIITDIESDLGQGVASTIKEDAQRTMKYFVEELNDGQQLHIN